MLRMFYKIFRTGVVTDPSPRDAEIEAMGSTVKRHVDRHFSGSFAIRAVDAGSCNGCEQELHALNNPWYDVERFGVHFVASPRHADALMVTGPVSRHMEAALRSTWEATPAPKWLIAVGDCACDGGEFGISYASSGAVENILPVDLKISGCPPTPHSLLTGLLAMFQTENS